MVRASRLLPVAVVVAALTAGCGGTDEDVTGSTGDEPATSSTAPADTAPALPTCRSVWAEGRTLPDTYLGCREGSEPVAKSLRCESGQELFTYAGRFFAVPGARIFAATGPLGDDPQYQRMHRTCTA